MSLEQYKDKNRAELWEILQIQAQVLQEEIRKNTELELKQRDIIRDIKVCFGYAVACDGNLLVNADAYNLLVATCNAKIKEQGDD